MPCIASSEASVAPAGPLPMIPTFLIVVLIMTTILVYDLGTKGKLSAFSHQASQSQSGRKPLESPLDSLSPEN
jgi:hypothetical protein